ncbi:SpaA isopeptide-forming pilin-related protein [Enterococcus pallens]|uniref:SpaA-like prealbumin fold domain-containing protein n=1 Tax=Enterococcus pallens ATCC BAA-351 TaxID=1158607 RepID=R2SSE2_9ENTE|nr:SpaA isopeptide-forming pilin-related protein [Enterococcus pallens]EOH90984.1 hypothetical protein UAU_03523 [Enterococcus pallens ATCC BAA-351]EOU16180.1 hypothetical protein I588_03836 [Enterococcus pallens ATCC BAA-351]
MHNQKRFKKLLALCLPLLIVLGVAGAISKGQFLKASNNESQLVTVFNEDEEVTGSFETAKEAVEITLTAKEAGIYSIPYDEANYSLDFVAKDANLTYYELAEEEFDIDVGIFRQPAPMMEKSETAISETEESEGIEESEPIEPQEEIQEAPEVISPVIEPLPDCGVFKVRNSEEQEKGEFYLKLEKGQAVTLSVQKNAQSDQLVVLSNAKDTEQKQTLIQFKSEAEENAPEKDTTEIKDNEKETSETVTKTEDVDGMEMSIAPLELREGPDVVRLKDPKLVIQTGEKNFDPDDAPGHDSSPTNDIVRTWDKVTYAYSFSLESTNPLKAYKDIKYQINAEFKESRKKVNGQLRDYAYFPEGMQTGNNGAEARDSYYSTSGTLASSSSIVDSVINLQVLGATHNYELFPTITITILEATDVDTGEIIPINAISENMVKKKVKVSAKPNVKATLAESGSDYNLMSTLTNDNSLNAMAKTLGVKFSVVPLTDSGIVRKGSLYEQLLGATYPTGKIDVEVQTSARFQPHSGTDHTIIYGTDQKQPQLTHYGFLAPNSENTDQLTKTPEFAHYTFKKMSINSPSSMPGSRDISTAKNTKYLVYDTNQLSASNKNVNTFSFSVNNPAAIHKDGLTRYASTTEENVGQSTFASIAGVVSIPYDYLLDKNGSIFTDFKTTTIEYEGQKKSNTSNYQYQRGNTLPGSIICFSPASDIYGRKIGTNPSQNWTPSGDGAIYKNEKFTTTGMYDAVSLDMKFLSGITAWNAHSFEYDSSRSVRSYARPSQGSDGKINSLLYGIKKDGKLTPDTTVRYSTMDSSYNWYATYDEAKAKGTISAIKTIAEKTGVEAGFKIATEIPLKAIGPVNNRAKDQFGNSNIVVSSARSLTNSNKELLSYPPNGSYKPTQYDEENKIQPGSEHQPANLYGNTLLIVPFSARITKSPVRTGYNSDEVVQWKLTPQIEANEDDEISFTIKDTLPKELAYIAGSAKYGSQLIEPSIKEETDGSTTLTWTIQYNKKNIPLQTLVFDTMVQGKHMQYDATNTKSVKNKAVISAENKDGLTDESLEILRTAEASTTITKVSTTVIEKSTVNSKIEVGTKDAALVDGEKNTTLNYRLYNKNESKYPMKDARILDVFPYFSDGRGTSFKGSFDLLSVKVTSVNIPKIYYTKQSINGSLNPNDIDVTSGWSVYTGGRVTDVKAIYLEYDQLNVGEDNTIDIALVAKNQKINDLFVNSAKLDNYNNNPVQSIYVKSTVIARSIKGVAWYDDNLDGKKNPSEAIVPNIPVKLYRTSNENKSYKDELVKENLTGFKFIDGSGNSTIKTNSSGEYEFPNLPEGDYVAYFEINGEVNAKKIKVTTKDSGTSSQTVDTSKVNSDTLKTDSYSTPTLTGGNFPNNEWKVENINLGLIRPGTINLFKYEAGTAIDGNKDGELSDPEKATGTPLKGAVFDLYEGHTGSGNKLGTATTDENGKLQFKDLFPGEYSLVETKAPSGFELLKKPLKVTITQGNQVIQLYQDNDVRTDLPFTGGDNPMIMILLAAASLMTVGFIGMMFYYRQPKRRRHTR